MATFVIVHGAFGGGWEWTPVAELLRQSRQTVFTPTLTGMGERSHLGPAVGMSTHVQDIVATIEFEDLSDVVLCGASYGGMAVTGAADRIPTRVAQIIYIDALVPLDGQSGADLLPAEFAEAVRNTGDAQGHGWVSIPPMILPPEGMIAESLHRGYVARLRPQPAASFTEPLALSGEADRLPRAFVRCTQRTFEIDSDPIESIAERARTNGWPYRELDAPHDPHLFDPVATAAVLLELATDSQG